jgi:hypothetical protein
MADGPFAPILGMKTMFAAAVAALVVVARVAIAQTASGEPVEGQAARAGGEARTLLLSMHEHARIAREALERARARRRPEEVRCADEALSRADVALRRGREDAAQMSVALAAHDAPAAATALRRLMGRFTASSDAAAVAGRCIPQEVARGTDRTQVTVYVDSKKRI